MTYTLKTLARRIALDDSDEAAATAARRVEHWASTGLFEFADVDIGPKALGRGRVRRYPEEALPWCLFWNELAERGLGIVAMTNLGLTIRATLSEKSRERGWLEKAMRGEGPALFLFDEIAATDQTFVGHRIHQSKWKFARSPIKLTDDWSGGFFINLTAVYGRAAKG